MAPNLGQKNNSNVTKTAASHLGRQRFFAALRGFVFSPVIDDEIFAVGKSNFPTFLFSYFPTFLPQKFDVSDREDAKRADSHLTMFLKGFHRMITQGRINI
jgi:hypothetical protein